ncbi:MAG TPA: UDP-N-acetylmuramoyl-L-alanyl-D-glutamate--2,6-diaminopimelate ligase [Ignavibacteria bacterium]|nr:UDP-N-acetylmuramoyl-L-alanyl-D-glutamate--2,6-diaminopimelate ligase [Ignavibacteria bacterium]
MKISEIISNVKVRMDHNFRNDIEISGLAYDSRKVEPGNIFFAIKGLKDDGNKFVGNAINKGAVIIFTEEDLTSEEKVEIVKVGNIRKLMAEMSKEYYFKNSSDIRLIGVTGTNGKTTTSYLIRNILEDAGYKAGLIGTIDYEYGETKMSSSLTTPDSIEMNQMLGEMTKLKADFCIMEVSSIALVMDRVHGLEFDTAVFTNLTSEHLDFHENMDNYFAAKKILFNNLNKNNFAVSNSDDPYGRIMLNETKAFRKFYSVNNESDLKAENVNLSLNGLEFETSFGDKTFKFRSDLSGRFNVYNILASMETALNYNIDISLIQRSILNFKEVNGRFNRLKLPNGAIAVIDYSHTSDSLKNAIEAAREIVIHENKNGKVITIFGCGGNKDRTKRPIMGEFATGLSDYAIITSDNPRYEEPMEIISEILKGIRNKKNYEVIENREEAIKKGIEISKPGDIVLICGKGHERYQEIKGVRNHFDDKEIVEKYKLLAA